MCDGTGSTVSLLRNEGQRFKSFSEDTDYWHTRALENRQQKECRMRRLSSRLRGKAALSPRNQPMIDRLSLLKPSPFRSWSQSINEGPHFGWPHFRRWRASLEAALPHRLELSWLRVVDTDGS